MTYYLLHNGQVSAERLARRVPRLVPVRELRQLAEDDVILRFGNTSGAESVGWTVNRRDGLEQTHSRKSMLKAFSRTGIPCPARRRENSEQETKLQLIRNYRIPVFNLKAIGCYRTEGKVVWLSKRINQVVDSFTEVNPDVDDQARRVCLLAVRAVHALGLEFGLVSIGINPYGRRFVLDVSPDPVLRGRLLDQFALATTEFMESFDRSQTGVDPGTILLGTDLEFMLRSRDGKMVLASKYFPAKGTVGCDDRSMAGDRDKRPLAEVRPDPGRTPEEVCQNIRSALRQATTMAKQPFPQWRAGSAPFEKFPIGGHIHFSGVPYTGRFVNLLDVYVGLPLMLIEDPTSNAKRRPKYGFLGDIRHKSYGGFEYRTPGSFLVDPEIAMGAMALAYVVAHHHASLPYVPLHRPDAIKAFYRSDRDQLLPIVEQVYLHLSQTPSFQRYRDVIDPIFTMIRQDEVWDESIDVRTAWGIPLASKAAGKRGGKTVAS